MFILCLFDFNNTNKSHIITFMVHFQQNISCLEIDDRFSEKNNCYIVNEYCKYSYMNSIFQ